MKKEDLKTKSILPPPPPHGRQDMGLKTHTGQANPNPNIKAQENTLLASSTKPLSPFKPKGTVKQTQTKPIPQTQTEPIPKSQIVGLSKAKQSQTKEPPNLIPSRRQFIEQYGAYALVTPVALYAMMSPNRAMAQAGSVGVIDPRPRVLRNGERIENFDINTKTDGDILGGGDLSIRQGHKYIASDGVTYTCVTTDGCWIVRTEGEGGKAFYGSEFDITYPDDIGSSNQAAADAAADIVADVAADTADDPVVDTRPRVFINGEVIPTFDITTKTDGRIDSFGDLALLRGEKYIAPDGVAYTCDSNNCAISADGYVNSSRLTVTYPNDIGLSNQAAADAVDDIVDDVAADAVDDIVDDAVADAMDDDSPRLLVKGERIENFDLTTATEGLIYADGIQLFEDSNKYTAPDGVVYTCTTQICIIDSLGENHLGILSYRPR